MEPHQQRVLNEKEDLDTKITKLSDFTNGSTFSSLPAEEQARLKKQFGIMRDYSSILGDRINAFPAEER